MQNVIKLTDIIKYKDFRHLGASPKTRLADRLIDNSEEKVYNKLQEDVRPFSPKNKNLRRGFSAHTVQSAKADGLNEFLFERVV